MTVVIFQPCVYLRLQITIEAHIISRYSNSASGDGCNNSTESVLACGKLKLIRLLCNTRVATAYDNGYKDLHMNVSYWDFNGTTKYTLCVNGSAQAKKKS